MKHAPAKENTVADRSSSVVSGLADDADSQLTPKLQTDESIDQHPIQEDRIDIISQSVCRMRPEYRP